MVGWLVQQQQVGMPQQDFRQLDTHSPTAGELAARTVKILAFESQTDDRPVHFGDKPRFVLVRDGHYFFAERSVVLKKHHLRQVSDGHVVLFGNTSRSGLVFAGNQAQQGCFARSVLAHQRDALLAVDKERDVVQHRSGRELHRYVINRQHCRIVSYSECAIRRASGRLPKRNPPAATARYSSFCPRSPSR